VAESIPLEARVGVLFRRVGDPEWRFANAWGGSRSPGYVDHWVPFWSNLFGTETPDEQAPPIEVVAFITFPDGTRLFDHNRFPGDFENAVLSPENGFALAESAECQPDVGKIWFAEGYTHWTAGQPHQGGYLWISYDLDRLPQCRNTDNGAAAWDTQVHMLFHPGEQHVSGSVRNVSTYHGHIVGIEEVPFWTKIPEDATRVEIWFENYSTSGTSCHAWDSDYGRNYHFAIWPSATNPSRQCTGVEKETGVRGEDPRMSWTAPACFEYDVAAHEDAGCEFSVDGFGNGYIGHYGIPYRWIVAYMKALPAAGEVLTAGLYVKYFDNIASKEDERLVMGIEEVPGVWRTGFAYEIAPVQREPRNATILEYAFFMDVRRGDRVVRLWHSRHGANYRLSDAFTLPPYTEGIPYGRIEWANQGASVLDSKHACQ